MPQLDGIRAIAVMGVIAHHTSQALPGSPSFGYLATAGVHIFFVLSGFLITSILLKLKKKVAHGSEDLLRGLRVFFIRRALRIYPLYFTVLLAAILINLGEARELAPWLATYTLNIKMGAQDWYEAYYAHFWTLAVEHQFYLAWPILIMALPSRTTWMAPVLAIVISLATKGFYVYSGYTSMTGLATYISTQSNLDLLALGSALSFVYPMVKARVSKAGPKAIGLLAYLPLAYVIAAFIIRQTGIGPKWADIVFGNLFSGLGYVGIVAVAGLSLPSMMGWLLGIAPLQYLGQISYGAYVFHPFIIDNMLPYLKSGIISSSQLVLITCIGTLLIAGASYYFLELPCMSLKSRLKA
ncbi:acyltransferase [Synechococcus sp. 1G10]|uniref:acyltransferase family protein n=1 Tax=Synechococcus sp. 1G10 TaxID=2025605 RepID=UPI0013035797|nr:acyltransferase [Synechococcus sp. 1G10]